MKQTIPILPILLVILIIITTEGLVQSNPCLNIIKFDSDIHENYGIITIPPLENGLITLKVKIGILDPIWGINSLSLVKSLNDTVADVQQGHSIQYKLNFLQSDELPNVLSITLNNEVICNRTETVDSRPEFNLEYTFTTPILLASRAGQPDDVSWLGSLDFAGTCGRTSKSTELIIGGTNVTKGEYPWMVALFHYEGRFPVYKCGASLISNKYVITAAHCTMDQTEVHLEFGKHDINKRFELHSLYRTSTNIFKHLEYEDQAHGDVALVSFEPVSFTRWIKPICLWANFDTKLRRGAVAGWGQQDNDDNSQSNTPRQSIISMIGLEMCRNSNAELRNIATDKTFCAGGQSSGPCHGDSGGGFYVIHNHVWYLRGIISRSIGTSWTCNVDEYAVYVDLAYSLDWIRPYLFDHPAMSLPPPVAVSTPPPPPRRISVVQETNSQYASWGSSPSPAPVTWPPPVIVPVANNPTIQQSNNATWLVSLPFAETCGREPEPLNTLEPIQSIIRGAWVNSEEFPWMVALFHYKIRTTEYKCASSLISNTYVITAAYCTRNQRRVYLELGRYNISDPDEEGYVARISLNIIPHPEHETAGHGSVALILIEHVEFTRKIKPICLWAQGTNLENILRQGTVTGWGRVAQDKDISRTLRKLSVRRVELDACRDPYSLLQYIPPNTTFCAGGNSPSPCHGDFGSGFYIRQGEVWYLRGIISTSLRHNFVCNLAEYALYVDLAFYLDWLRLYLLP